jgi:glycosyltransferase involved in cell wall biosynthesis
MNTTADSGAPIVSSVGSSPARKLLVIDSAFTFEAIRERRLEASVTCRDLDGFFEHVWTVHPFATLLTSPGWSSKFGRPNRYRLNDRHTFIEGKVGATRWLQRLFPLNFLISQLMLFLELRKLIKKERISIIRVGDPLYLGLLGWALARSTGIPFVVRVGGNHDKFYATTGRAITPRLMFNRSIEKKVERFIFPRADLVAGANQDNLDFALANGARPEASTLFRYGNLIDKRHFLDPADRALDREALGELGLQPGKYLLYIGRLEAIKHPEDVILALSHVRGRGYDVKAALCGDGTERARLADLARELGIEDQVVLAGNRSQDWLIHAIAGAAVVVSPHTGRALSEAALGAAPIVAYDVDWQGELIETGVTGELVKHRDQEAFSRSVETMLADPAYARAMGNAVRERALQMLDPDALDAHERSEYAKLLARRCDR